jgi:hypothetical protein
MTDFADDSSISMNANFAEDNDDSKTNGKNGIFITKLTNIYF